MANDGTFAGRKRAECIVTTTIDFGDLRRRLMDAERRVFARHERKILSFVRSEWTGWEYKGRPAKAPRLVSHDAWKSEIQTTEGRAVLRVYNEARDYRGGGAYAGFIHRAGRSPEDVEHVRVWARVRATLEPAMRQELTAEVHKNVDAAARPQRIRGGRSTRASARSTTRVR